MTSSMTGLGLGPRSWLPAAVTTVAAAAVTAVLLAVTGVSWRESCAASAVVWLNAIPFALLWCGLLSRRVGLIESWGVGLALSTAVDFGLNLALLGTPVGGLRWWFLPVATALLLAVPAVRRRLSRPPRLRASDVLALALAVVLGLLVHVFDIYRAPLYGVAAIDAINPDEYLFEAMGDAIAGFGPHESGIMAGVGFRYHWFAYAWNGWLSGQVAAEPLVVLLRVLPMVSLIGLASVAIGLTRRTMRARWAPAVVAVALVAGTSIDYFTGSAVNWSSGSFSLGGLWLLALILLSVVVLTASRPTPLWVLVVVLAVAATGGKASHGAVAVGAVGLLALSGQMRHELWRRRAWVTALLVGAATAVGFLAALSGQPSAGGLGLRESTATLAPTAVDSLYGWVVAAVAAMGARLIRILGLGFAIADSRGRRWPITWMASGSVAVAAVLYSVFRNDIATEQWFMESAALVAVPAAAMGVCLFLSEVWWVSPRRVAPLVVAVAGGIAVAVSAFALHESALDDSRAYLPFFVAILIALVFAVILTLLQSHHGYAWARVLLGWLSVVGLCASVAMPVLWEAVPIARGGLSAARPSLIYSYAADSVLRPVSGNSSIRLPAARDLVDYLRTHGSRQDIVAVNGSATSWLPALADMRAYAAFPEQLIAWSTPTPMAEFERRQSLVTEFLTDASPSAARALCAEGVRWVVDLESGSGSVTFGTPPVIGLLMPCEP